MVKLQREGRALRHFNSKARNHRRSIATIRETLTRTTERLASVQIEQRDFAEMFAAIGRLKGKVLLSFDDHPEIRERAAEHKLHTRTTCRI